MNKVFYIVMAVVAVVGLGVVYLFADTHPSPAGAPAAAPVSDSQFKNLKIP